MDDRDRRLLLLLQEDSHTTNASLADRAGMSLSSCARRIARFWSDRLILCAPAKLDRSKFTRTVGVFVMVTLQAPKSKVSNGFAERICKFPSVQQCHAVTGDFDYLLLIEEASIEAYHDFAQSTFGEWNEVQAYRSTFLLKTAKNIDCIQQPFL